MLADRIEADLALGEGASLVGELRALLSADPLAERPRALLMRALYAAGRQAEALAVYHEGRELLADQLGVDPSAQLEQVYLRILRGEKGVLAVATGGASPIRPGRGPGRRAAAGRAQTPLTSFVGRDEDLPRVLKNLRAARLVTLTGPGGVGKTRLVAETAGQLAVTSWFVPLAPVTDPAEVPRRCWTRSASASASSPAGPAIPARARWTGWPPRSADRDDVLILDNCEHVIEAAAALAGQVLADCPRVRIVATSRQPLRIDGETLCPVSAAARPARPGRSAVAVGLRVGPAAARPGGWRSARTSS